MVKTSAIPVVRLTFVAVLAATLLCITGCSSSSNDHLVPDDPALPPAPKSVIGDAGRERAIIRWTPVEEADTFTIYYAETAGFSKESSTRLEDRHPPHIQRGLENGTTYFFAVASVNQHGEGPLSTEVSVTPSATPPPYAPADLVTESDFGQIRLTWLPSDAATRYSLYYDTEPGVSPKTGIQIFNAVSPQIVGPLAQNVTYYFVVTASNANGESAASFEASEVPLDNPPPPPPENVKAVEGNEKIIITWTHADDVDSYNAYYATGYFLSKDTSTKLKNVTSPLAISGLKNNTAQFAFITAVNQDGESAKSKTISATPVAQKPVHTMIEIPGGSFQMGNSVDDNPEENYYLPVQMVHVDTFYIDRYEMSYDLWREVYEWAIPNGYDFDSEGYNGTIGIGTNMPVTSVNWFDVVKWLNARSEYEGHDPVYFTDTDHTKIYRTGQVDLTNDMVAWNANGYRLPTGAEWEKAARGGLTGKRFPWGDRMPTTIDANYNMGRAVSIGLYPPNGYGLHDMAGNVWGWVWDREFDNYDWASGVDNPRGPEQGVNRIRRGGAYTYGPLLLQCHEMMFRLQIYKAPYFGFRAARSSQ